MEERHAKELAARDESHQANGSRSLTSNGQEAASNGEDWAAKAAVQREEVGWGWCCRWSCVYNAAVKHP